MARVIAIASQKGGVGKTTTAVNLAGYMALAGHSCLLVDLDPQANATSGLGIESPPRSHLPALLDGTLDWKEVSEETAIEGLRCLPSTVNLEVPVATAEARGGGAQRLRQQWLDAPSSQLDVVILDCPPSLGPLTDLALHIADSVLVPVQCEYFAMEGLAQVLELVRRAESSLERKIVLEGLVLTLFSPEVDLCHEVAEEVRRYFPKDTLDTPVLRDPALAEAASYGQPICLYQPRSAGAWSYLNLTKEVLEHEWTETGTRARCPDPAH